MPICEQILESVLYRRCIAYFEKAFHTLPEPDGPCVVHFDFRPGNILVQNDTIVGLIDFESARGGSSEVDFTKINRYVWTTYPGTKSAFEEGYKSIRPLISLEAVLPFYSFYDAFSSVVWCQRRGMDKNRKFLEDSISTLQEMVV
jgi:aminoglycoside phosphotransferase (APT) family kinase protein